MNYEKLVDGLCAEVVEHDDGDPDNSNMTLLISVANISYENRAYAEQITQHLNEMFAIIAEGALDEALK